MHVTYIMNTCAVLCMNLHHNAEWEGTSMGAFWGVDAPYEVGESRCSGKKGNAPATRNFIQFRRRQLTRLEIWTCRAGSTQYIPVCMNKECATCAPKGRDRDDLGDSCVTHKRIRHAILGEPNKLPRIVSRGFRSTVQLN